MSHSSAEGQESISYQALLNENQVLLDKNRILENENHSLRARLEEAEELKRAITEGDLDALVIPGLEGELIFTLDSSDRAYRALVETMNEGTATLAFDGTILYCNHRLSELLNMPSQSILGTSIYQFIAPESTVNFNACLKHKMNTGEINLKTKDGSSLPVLMSISSMQTEGSPSAWCFVVTDLTEQKKNEEIIASERLASSIIEQAAEIIAVCDTSGRIIRFSNSMPKLCGCDPTFQRFEDIINLQFADGEVKGESFLPVSSTLKGSTILGVETIFEPEEHQRFYFLLNSGPLKNANGKIIGCTVTLTDITNRKRIENELIASERNLAASQEIAHTGSYSWDLENNKLIWSDELYRILGLKPKQISPSYDTYASFIHPDDKDEAIKKIKSIIEVGMTQPNEHRIVRSNGTVRFVQVKSKVLRENNGKPRAIYGTVQDITESKQMEKQLQESEEQYRTFFENSIDAVLLTSPDGTVYAANPAACRTFGMTEEEIIRAGRNGTVDLSDPRLQSALEERARTGKFKGELNYRRKDGTIFPGEVSTALFKDKNGAVRTTMIIRDITERKKAEEGLLRSESKFRTLAENSPDMIVRTDGQGRLIYVNPVVAKGYGRSQKEMIGKTLGELGVDPERVKFWEKYHKTVFDTKESKTVEFQYISPLGKKYYFNTLTVPEFIDGEVVSVLDISRDLSNIKEIETKLKETLDNLENIVQERTAELHEAYILLKESEKSLAESQEIAHIGSWDWDIVTNKVHWSCETYRIFGLNPQELEASFGLYFSYVHPDDRESIENEVKEALKGKTYSIDYRIILPNGERTVHSYGKVTFDENNVPIRMKGTTQDITERKRLEEALESEARLPHENPSPVIRLSQGRVINYANPAAQVLLTGWGSTIGQEAPVEITDVAIASLCNGIHRKLEYNLNDRTYLLNLAPFPQAGYANLYANDITELKKAVEALVKIEIARKQEIHHRIKNNLQVISSLLDLQAEQFRGRKSIKDSEVLEAFKESQDRVISMALIHEELYKGGGFATLNFTPYIKELAENLLQTYRLGNTDISLNMDLAENAFFDMDIAVPLGIIVNELVSNSLKHAFIGRDEGEIGIKLVREESIEFEGKDCEISNFVLTISDNGVGIPELDFEDLDSLGIQLINALVDQLDGEFELKRNNGTEFIMKFAVKENNSSEPVPAPQLIE